MRKSAAATSARATTRRPRTSLIDAEWDALHLRLVTSPAHVPPPLPVVTRRSLPPRSRGGLPRPHAKLLRPGTKVRGTGPGKRRTLSFAIVFTLVTAAVFGLWAKPVASVRTAAAFNAPPLSAPSPEYVDPRVLEPPPPISVAEPPLSELVLSANLPAEEVLPADAALERAKADGKVRSTAAAKPRAGAARSRSGAKNRARREASNDNPY